jgi:hypothetical protein
MYLDVPVAIKEMTVQSSRERQPEEYRDELDGAKQEMKILWELRHPK